jgi:hypothetical protein
MSIVLNTYAPADKGYFRIGHVALSIPPEDIITNRVENSDELATLRAKYPMILKTGQARWDVTISWKALLTYNEDGSTNYTEWEKLRTIMAIFKAAPFVEIENEHIRGMLSKQDSNYSHERLSFGLRQLRIDTIPDVIDGLQATLTMTLFNFLPYTSDFSYKGATGSQTDAPNSPQFADYISTWMRENLDTRPKSTSLAEEEEPPNWKEQNSGRMAFLWRTYQSTSEADAKELVKQGWHKDHFTDRTTFTFIPNLLVLSTLEEAPEENLDTFITNISIVLVNNLAQIPLSNYQYPTYQHIGPAATAVSVQMISSNMDGDVIPSISRMLDALNSQYLKMRTEWRSVSSVHRMQAILVENQILNMFGIFGLQPKGLQTETVREANQIQAQLMAVQYENMFEEVKPFRVKSPNSIYQSSLANFVEDPKGFESLTDAEKNSTSSVKAFSDARKAHDDSYLKGVLLKQDAQTLDAVSALPSVPLPVHATPAEVQAIRQILDSTIGDKRIRDLYPKIAARATGTTIDYTDYWMLTRLAEGIGHFPLEGAVADFRKRTDAAADAKTPNPKDDLYNYVFLSKSQSDPLFKAELHNLLTSPTYKAQNDQISGSGPASDPENAGHGAYRDLGLKSALLRSQDFNPGFYFYDYGKDVQKGMWDNLSKDIGKALAVFQRMHQNAGQDGRLDYFADQGLSGNSPSTIMQRASVPGFSMANAFPTFKLFLMEEDNLGIYYCHDDFYSYSSVTDIEIIRYRDMPDTAVIQLTNLAGLLSHKLFDSSTQGRRELELSNNIRQPKSSDDDATAGPAGGDVVAAENVNGENFQEGYGSVFDPAVQTPGHEPSNKVPLRYYALQTGSKIQIRMGFTNDPDKLTPVFSGTVTQLDEENGLVTLQAQGFQIELMASSDDEIRTDGWSPFGISGNIVEGIAGSTLSLISGHPIDAVSRLWSGFARKAPAFGGAAIFGPSGDADSVMIDMLKNSAAKHFGHWQLDFANLKPAYLKGYRWQDAAGGILGVVNARAGEALKGLNDRRGENILINRLINADGTVKLGSIESLQRSWQFEHGVIFPPEYHVPSDNPLPPWMYIKDVGRRYPEYILAVKQYGFPYQADATLVYAHPNDWYYARLPLLGEQQAADDKTDGPAFGEWWVSGGRDKFINFVENDLKTIVKRGVLSLYEDPNTDLSVATLDQADINTNAEVAKVDSSGPSYEVFSRLLDVYNKILTESESEDEPFRTWFPNLFGKEKRRMRTELNSLRSDALHYVSAKRTGSMLRPNPGDWVRPVRRYHFIDDKMVVNNGIKLNDTIYNTVQVAKEPVVINEFIPDHHRRMLNVNDVVVDWENNLDGADKKEVRMSYAQSFLREEVGKMYRGELILRGTPEIEPWDVIFLTDPATGVVGPVEVDSVIHSFNQEMGYITIIKPRALVIINEAATLNYLPLLINAFARADAIARGFGRELQQASGIELGLVTAGTTGALITAGAAISIFGGPAGWILGAMLGLAGYAIIGASNRLSACFVVPVSRFGRPWLGGLQGYRISDLAGLFASEWKQFKVDEIYPLLESARLAGNIISPSLSRVDTRPPGTPVSGSGIGRSQDLEGMDPAAAAAASNWLKDVRDHGHSYTVTSTYRSTAEQTKLYDAWIARGKTGLPAAPPGHSNHQSGKAIDVSFDNQSGLSYAASVAPKYGFKWLGLKDHVHFDYVGS